MYLYGFAKNWPNVKCLMKHFHFEFKISIQLFRQRLSKKSVKAYATMPKGGLENTQ